MESMQKLTKKRSNVKAQLTRFQNFLSNLDEQKPDWKELENRLVKIDNILQIFNNIQEQIEDLDTDEVDSIERESFENSYFKSITLAKNIIAKHSSVKIEVASQCSNIGIGNINQSKLPDINLPFFDGSYDQWLFYRDTFRSIIHNNVTITNVQKFHYLRLSLKGEAADVIKFLETSDDNYAVAWDLLTERFENKKYLISNHVKAIFDLPVMNRESRDGIHKLLNGLTKHLRALQVLGEPIQHWDTLLIHLICSKLDNSTRRDWESKFTNKKPLFSDLTNFLKDKHRLLETLTTNNNEVEKSRFKSKSFITTNINICYFCKGRHYIYFCKDFLKLDIKSRFEKVKQLNLCINCLKKNHSVNACKAGGCKICNKRHNTLLHFSKTNDNISENSNAEVNENTEQILVHSSCNSDVTNVLLSTAIIKIADQFGNFHNARVLLDSASQSNFITQDLYSKLQLNKSKINLKVAGINNSNTQVNYRTSVKINSLNSSFVSNVSCLIIPNITGYLPTNSFNLNNIHIPNTIKLADPTFNISGKIDMLLGATIFWELLCVGQIKLGKHKPLLQKTQLGWIISGEILDSQINSNFSKNLTHCNFISNQQLDNNLTKFWNIENIENTKIVSDEEINFENYFVENTKRDDNGRFIVKLPFKHSTSKLGNSKQSALNRFFALERKFTRFPETKTQYVKFMKEYAELNHMTKIIDDDNLAFYLPHHFVIKESSMTTKLRVVFDASMKSSSGFSLNDLQLTGSVQQLDLFSIVLNFRIHNIVLAADITKMYRQILIHPDDKRFQRIFWRENSFDPLECFELNTVTYGTAAASFLAVRCLFQLAENYSNIYPKSSEVIKSCFYMDDLLTGGRDIMEIQKMYIEISEILKSGGFELNKWVSNDRNFLESIKNSNSEVILNIGDNNESKTLGLTWHADSDILKYCIKDFQNNKKVTKRNILSIVSQIFDPLGLLGPCIIISKIILQRLWQCKLDWDESVPFDLQTQWLQFQNQIHYLNHCKVPRQIICFQPVNIELHGFTDASESAYGACLYVRSTDATGNCSVKLLCAKSRVAPLKTLTIPRLELSGALLLAQLVDKINHSFNLKFDKFWFWCDSKIVLSWINSSPHRWKIFVGNRVAQIQSLVSKHDWHYINTSENPADLITRGVEALHLKDMSLWWSGPEWLSDNQNSWPIYCSITDLQSNDIANDCQLESRKVENTYVTSTLPDLDLFNKFSNLTKLQRVVAYCLRFKNNCLKSKHNRQNGHLSCIELQFTLNKLVQLSQSQSFEAEINHLRKSKPLQVKSKLLGFNPFLDELQIMRVGGRLKNSSFSDDKKHPIILSAKHELSRLIIQREHIRLLHAGPQALLANIREQFWIIGGRNLVKSVVRNCLKCFRVNPRDNTYIMGDLPNYRITSSRPFLNCGVDFAGPFYVRDRKGKRYQKSKAYICLFICFATKAIHLELVSDLTSEAFIAALRRFESRRGKCIHIFSDNATNFQGAKSEINKFILQSKNDIQVNLSQDNITWHFIPPRAPNFGGLWEAGVKSTKFHLKRVIGNALLTYEEFLTVLTQIEACLNSRPLYPLSNDPNDPSPLTPGHFLIGEVIKGIPDPNMADIQDNRLSRFQRLQKLKQHFWRRWSKEYISELQVRSKWKQKGPELAVPGALVLVKEDNLPPLSWKLGRITEIQPGEDGVTRVASLKTVGGVVKRPLSKLCVLPSDVN